MNKRESIIDILKGIGIILIVLGHTNFPYTHFIYLFHVELFIIASGYFFKDDKVSSFKQLLKYIAQKIKKLYLPYIIINVLFVLLNNILLDLHIYSLNTHTYYNLNDFIINVAKVLLFQGVTEIGGATWFLQLLFGTIVLYAINNFIIIKTGKNKYFYNIIFSIIYFIIGMIFLKKNYFVESSLKIVQILYSYGLFFFGNVFSNFVKNCLKKNKKNNYINYTIILIALIILIILSRYGKIEVSKNVYTNVIYFIATSIIGFLFIYEISKLIDNLKLKIILSYIGLHSFLIFSLHFLAFKFINVIIVILFGFPISFLGKFPTINIRFSWIYYTIGGIMIPIIINCIYTKLKEKIHEKIRSSNSNI